MWNLEADDWMSCYRVRRFGPLGYVGIDSGTTDNAGLFIDWRRYISGGKIVYLRINGYSQSAA
jgi:hypothetical protein